MYNSSSPIGVFDSGVGGLSVLLEIQKKLPSEHLIYYGDNAHAPYGVKTKEEITELARSAFSFLISKNVKAVVIACNTATAVAVDSLRKEFEDFIIIGVEPAIKPAALSKKHPKVLIMATPVTVHQERVLHLVDSLEEEAEFTLLPCTGLVEYIEKGEFHTKEFQTFLKNLLKNEIENPPDAVVLGCTHYPFILDSLKSLFPENVLFFDGAAGTAKQLQKRLKERNLLNTEKEKGTLSLFSSDNRKIPFMKELCGL